MLQFPVHCSRQPWLSQSMRQELTQQPSKCRAHDTRKAHRTLAISHLVKQPLHHIKLLYCMFSDYLLCSANECVQLRASKHCNRNLTNATVELTIDWRQAGFETKKRLQQKGRRVKMQPQVLGQAYAGTVLTVSNPRG